MKAGKYVRRRARGEVSRHLPQRRSAGAQRLGARRSTAGLQPPSSTTKVFELILRLKANYLWPAMWGNAFNEDDPLNPKLADEYGIVMGTIAPRADAARAAGVEAPRHRPLELREERRGAAQVLGRRRRAQQELREHHHHRHARRWRHADGRDRAGRQHRAAGEDRGRPAQDHRRAGQSQSRRRAAGLGALQRGAGILRQRACACRTT